MKTPSGIAGKKFKWGIGMVLLFVLASVSSLVRAQTPDDHPPLSISNVAATELAVAGDTLTYFITLTNTGQVPLEAVVVSDTAPTGTTVFGASGPSGWWTTTISDQGQPEQVVWRIENPLLPGEAVTLQLMVTVAANAAGQIVNDGYEVRAAGWAKPVGGPPVLTRVIAPTPTRTLQPLPTETPTQTPTVIPTKIPTMAPAATATAPLAVVPKQVQSPTPIPAPSSPNSPPEKTGIDTEMKIMIWLGLGALMIVLVIVFFVVKPRQ
ncbi:MAG: DUF11 domain-containing protein [Anaerolineae bacterium]|nr:DUF11 domain-containing protein [Anaerolineae bacterium]